MRKSAIPNEVSSRTRVTSNSDDKGADPEFLAGFSRTFAQQKFCVTAGAYFGERQKLDGGLYVGETIPTSLTGDFPVTKSYHVGWAFGLSYRFASTKDPTTNQSKHLRENLQAAMLQIPAETCAKLDSINE